MASTLSADRVAAAAGNNVALDAAITASKQTHFTQTKKSGLFSSGGVNISISIGSSQSSSKTEQTSSTAQGSTVAPPGGPVPTNQQQDLIRIYRGGEPPKAQAPGAQP